MNRRPQLTIVAPDASPQEAAAVVAALEQFMRDTAPPRLDPPPPALTAWKREAMLEGVSRQPFPAPPWA